jgi:hypothetical protein
VSLHILDEVSVRFAVGRRDQGPLGFWHDKFFSVCEEIVSLCLTGRSVVEICGR